MPSSAFIQSLLLASESKILTAYSKALESHGGVC